MKKCPFCAEEIQDEAIKCRHCGENLVKKSPWYFSSGSLFVSFLFIGPFMLPLVWFHPTMDRQTKTLWTVVVSVVSVFAIWSTYQAVVKIIAYYKLLATF